MSALRERTGCGVLDACVRTLLCVLLLLPAVVQAASISSGRFHGLWVKDDGTLSAWGYNATGQVGDGCYIDRSFPVPVPGLTGVRATAGGLSHSLALKTDGTVWAWGENDSGQLGDGTGYWQGRKGYPCRACDATGEQGQPDRLFVAVLTGPDNTERGDYTYLGQIIKAPHPRYEHGGKSRIGADALSARAAHWYFTRLFGVGDLSSCEFWHDGVCGRCGKDLTNPPSVACGYGEECADKLGIPWG